MVFINFISYIYKYITDIICIFSQTKKKKENILTHYSEEYNNEFDHYYTNDEHTELNDDIYKNRSIPINNTHTRSPNMMLKKSQSYVLTTYCCGYCERNIRLPQYMYSDNTYCSVTCRNNQINCDNKNNSNLVRQSKSFSM